MPLTTLFIGIIFICLILRNVDAKVVAIFLLTLLCCTWAHFQEVGAKQEAAKMKLRELQENWDKPKIKF